MNINKLVMIILALLSTSYGRSMEKYTDTTRVLPYGVSSFSMINGLEYSNRIDKDGFVFLMPKNTNLSGWVMAANQYFCSCNIDGIFKDAEKDEKKMLFARVLTEHSLGIFALIHHMALAVEQLDVAESVTRARVLIDFLKMDSKNFGQLMNNIFSVKNAVYEFQEKIKKTQYWEESIELLNLFCGTIDNSIQNVNPKDIYVVIRRIVDNNKNNSSSGFIYEDIQKLKNIADDNKKYRKLCEKEMELIKITKQLIENNETIRKFLSNKFESSEYAQYILDADSEEQTSCCCKIG